MVPVSSSLNRATQIWVEDYRPHPSVCYFGSFMHAVICGIGALILLAVAFYYGTMWQQIFAALTFGGAYWHHFRCRAAYWEASRRFRERFPGEADHILSCAK